MRLSDLKFKRYENPSWERAIIPVGPGRKEVCVFRRLYDHTFVVSEYAYGFSFNMDANNEWKSDDILAIQSVLFELTKGSKYETILE